MKKLAILFASLTIFICLGSVYAWSIFVPALQQEFGYSVAQTQLVFGICFFTLTGTMVLAGRLQNRVGSRWLAMLSGLLFLFACVTASFWADNFVILLLSMGFLWGLGVGFGYISALVTATKLFPERCGLAGGMVVSGYGLGAILLSFIAERFFAAGLNVEQIFLRIGLIYGAVIFVCGSCLVAPRPAGEALKKVRTREAVRERSFWAMATGMFCGSFAALLIIGNLKSIGLEFGFSPSLAALSVGFMAIGNSSGRIFWGAVFDRKKGKSIGVMLLFIAITVLLVWVLRGAFWSYALAVCLMAFCYSGCFSVYPAQVGIVYGIHSIARIYPPIILFHGLACLIAAPLGGLSFDIFGSYVPGMFLAVAVMSLGVAGHYILSRPLKVSFT